MPQKKHSELLESRPLPHRELPKKPTVLLESKQPLHKELWKKHNVLLENKLLLRREKQSVLLESRPQPLNAAPC